MSTKRTLMLGLAVVTVFMVLDFTVSGVGLFDHGFGPDFGVRIDYRRPHTEPTTSRPDHLSPLAGTWEALSVAHIAGDVEVRRTEGNQLSADYTVKVWSPSKSAAEAFADQVRLAWVKEGTEVLLRIEQPQDRPESIRDMRIDVTLEVPDGIDVSLDTEGTTTVEGLRGAVSVRHAAGALSVTDTAGPVEVTSQFADVSLRRVAGNVTVDHRGGRLTISDVQGDVKGEVRFGPLHVEGVAGNVTFAANQGPAEFRGIGGALDVNGGFGYVRADDLEGPAHIEYRNGSVQVHGLKKEADIANSFGDITVGIVENVGWKVTAEVERGDINSQFPLDQSGSDSKRRLDGVIGDGSEPLNLHMRFGQIKLARD